jgi:hypothetical protein
MEELGKSISDDEREKISGLKFQIQIIPKK